MKEVKGAVADNMINISLSGHIDSENAEAVKKEVFAVADQAPGLPVTVDAEDLKYISSAGLRVLLQLRKSHEDLRIINVNSEIYEIFEMTGFTEMMNISKAYKVVSVEGCEVIGKGANGTIYRIDKDNVVKVYNNPEALEEISKEREVAKLALILGIPTAISYDIVKVGDTYGSVFELLNARSFAKILADEPERIEWCEDEYVEMLHKIHSTVVPAGKLPDMKKTALSWATFMKDYLPAETGDKLYAMIDAIPHNDHMIHGDYHTKNLELTGDEVLLIDMDTLAVGDPVFELASMFNAFQGFSELDHNIVKEFQGFSYEIATEFWKGSLSKYLGTTDEEKNREVEDKARIVGYTRLIRRSIRRKGLESDERRAEIEHWTKELIELVSRIDELTFTA